MWDVKRVVMANMSTKRLLFNMSLFHVNENSVLLTRVLLYVRNSIHKTTIRENRIVQIWNNSPQETLVSSKKINLIHAYKKE